MWIFCCGMIRSASTLQYQLAAELVESRGRGRRLPWFPPEQFGAIRAEQAEQPGWKVVKVHPCLPEIAAELTSGRARGLYSFRDLRDVVVSLMRKDDVACTRGFATRVVRDCLVHYDRWTRLPEIHVSRYEDLVGALPAETARIAQHLGIPLEPAEAAALAERFGLDQQRARLEEAERRGSFVRPGGGKHQFDPVSLLHTNHIHSGALQGWRSALTRQQLRWIDAAAGDWLQQRGYPPSFPG